MNKKRNTKLNSQLDEERNTTPMGLDLGGILNGAQLHVSKRMPLDMRLELAQEFEAENHPGKSVIEFRSKQK